MAPQYKLTYFDIRGIVEPIRYLFHYANVEFEDHRIQRANWESVKADYPWGVLPILEENGQVLCQSFAIIRYLAKKYNLTGANDFEAAKCDEYGDALKDFHKDCHGLFLESDPVKKEEFRQNIILKVIPKYLPKFNADIEKNGGKYVVGKQYTWLDFMVAHYLDFFTSVMDASILNKYPAVQAHSKGVLNIPQIQAWIKIRPKTDM